MPKPKKPPQWQTLIVVKMKMNSHRNPVVMKVDQNDGTGELSFHFGQLRAGRVHEFKFWRESVITDLAMLANFGQLIALRNTLLGGVNLEELEHLIKRSERYELVEQYIPSGK